jgi:hypothetical protein
MNTRCYPKVFGLPVASQEEEWWYGVLPVGGDSVRFYEQFGAILAFLAFFSVIDFMYLQVRLLNVI